jgi:tetratricopeptide (TPR) repeat protein
MCYSSLALILFGTVGCQMSSRGYNVDGVRNYHVGRYQEAIQSFQQALTNDPNSADAYYNLAATYYELGKRNSDRNLLGQAEGLYNQCLDLDPNHTECYRGLAALLVDTDRSRSAFTLLKGWAQQNVQAADARIELARLYEEFGDKESASRYLTDALNIDARNPRAWTALARLREDQGQLAQALSNYQQAYQLNQYHPGVANRIASLQQRIATSGGVTQPNTQVVNTPQNSTAR